MKKKILNIFSSSEELKNKIKEYADKEGRTVSGFCRYYMEQIIAEKESENGR